MCCSPCLKNLKYAMQCIVLKELVTFTALKENKLDSCNILWACWQKGSEAGVECETIACRPYSNNEFLPTKLITLSEENRNMQLSWQHASKHLPVLGVGIVSTSARHSEPQCLTFFLWLCILHTTDTLLIHRYFPTFTHTVLCTYLCVCLSVCVYVCVHAFRAWAGSHSSSLTPNNVTIVAPGAGNLGVSPSVSKRGLTIGWMER